VILPWACPMGGRLSLIRAVGPLIFRRLRGLKRKTTLKEARMARLIYSAIMSLDGYIADADGRFEWAAPTRSRSAS